MRPAASLAALLSLLACSAGSGPPRGDGGGADGAATQDAGGDAGGADAAGSDAGKADGSASDAGGPDGGSADGGGADAGGGDGGACLGAPGDYSDTLSFGGHDRTWDVHVPPGYDCHVPTPLVFNFHGTTKDIAYEKTLTKMIPKADAAGFIVVFPLGYGGSLDRGWNAGGTCCGAPVSLGLDDVGLVKAILARLETQYNVDPRRVFSTGHSSGGFLSDRLACEAPDLFAAIAPVAAVNTAPTCTPARAVPVLHFHGTADQVVPYGGSTIFGFPSVETTMSGWAARDGCGPTRSVVFQNGDSTCESYDACPPGVAVTLCTVTGGGHTWPGGTPDPLFGKTTTDLSATDMMWDFFAAHPLP